MKWIERPQVGTSLNSLRAHEPRGGTRSETWHIGGILAGTAYAWASFGVVMALTAGKDAPLPLPGGFLIFPQLTPLLLAYALVGVLFSVGLHWLSRRQMPRDLALGVIGLNPFLWLPLVGLLPMLFRLLAQNPSRFFGELPAGVAAGVLVLVLEGWGALGPLLLLRVGLEWDDLRVAAETLGALGPLLLLRVRLLTARGWLIGSLINIAWSCTVLPPEVYFYSHALNLEHIGLPDRVLIGGLSALGLGIVLGFHDRGGVKWVGLIRG